MLARLMAITIKEFWAILRDPRARIILIMPPLIQLFVLGFATTLEVKNIAVGIYDRDGGRWSIEMTQRIAGSPNVVAILPISSPEEMRQAIDRQQTIAVVSFAQGFSADVAAGRPAVVQAIFDGRKSNAAQIVLGYLNTIVADLGAELSATPARTGAIVNHWFNPNLLYLWFTMPGLVVIITTISGLGLTAQAVARERELGTFDQLMVSPLRVPEILIGKVIPPVLVGFINATIYMVLISTLFGVPLTGSVPFFYISLLLYLLALAGVGLLVSSLSQTQQQAFLGMFLVAVPAILLSGYASPVDNMPGWLRILAQGDPTKHFLIVSEGVFLKDMTVPDLWANTWPLAVIAIVTLGVSSALFRARME
ncbi:ABC transporter permease [Aliiruegeria lutimaris]|uniref:ABC-2 type transport system permease protein n=1 Tax=Aliiruegeria lutimaris TaxID=571298 RepID=A0A1G8YKI2_9RHOB|nr:ABC transporter permease [Aliiruegeria lutimaris]SDK03379.1 ABC-2 type transport system permease protein [Aliiruegeria lutimaris]